MQKYLLAILCCLPVFAQAAVISVGRSVVITGGTSVPSSCEIRYAQCLGKQELSPERMELLIKEVLKRKQQTPARPENTIVEKPSKPYIVPEKKLTQSQQVLQSKLNQINIQKGN